HRGPVRLPGELILAHPLQLDRPPVRRPGEQRRVERDVVGAVVPVAARPFRMVYGNTLERKAENHGNFVPKAEDALAVGPDLELAVLQPGDRARGSDRGMRDERLRIGRADAFPRWGTPLDLLEDGPRGHVLAQPAVE